ncbi:MAG: ABC transporter substrate-binding protein [Microbacterium sp.]
MSRPAPLLLTALLVPVLLLVGCSKSVSTDVDEGTQAVTGGTLVYATGDAEPDCLDPHVGGNYPQALISSQYLEPLFGRNGDGEIVPWLATEGTVSDDGLAWSITLRDDITFTDGTPFDADAVKANIQHLQNPDTQSSTGYLAVEQVSDVEVVDATHLVLHLSTPRSGMLEALSQPWTAMESPAGIDRGMDENCASPIGTGPFVVSEWVPQDHVTLTRNEDYVSTNPQADHDGAAYLDAITWRFIPDAATREAALVGGEVNVSDNPLPSDIVAADDQGITHINAPRPASSNRIELNTAQAPFDDIAVREAFIRAADPNPGIESLFLGTVKRSYSPLSSVEPYAYSEESLFTTDVDRANELLDDAGWSERDEDGIRVKDGQRLTVRFPVSTNQSTAAEQSLFEQIQANEAVVGFDVQLDPVDLSTWYGALGAHEYEAVSAPYTIVGPDVLRILYHSSGTVPAPSGYFANHAMLSLPALDETLDLASAASDEDERGSLYQKAQQDILESYAILPLYDQQNHFLVNGATGVTTLDTVSTPTFVNAQLIEAAN